MRTFLKFKSTKLAKINALCLHHFYTGRNDHEVMIFTIDARIEDLFDSQCLVAHFDGVFESDFFHFFIDLSGTSNPLGTVNPVVDAVDFYTAKLDLTHEAVVIAWLQDEAEVLPYISLSIERLRSCWHIKHRALDSEGTEKRLYKVIFIACKGGFFNDRRRRAVDMDTYKVMCVKAPPSPCGHRRGDSHASYLCVDKGIIANHFQAFRQDDLIRLDTIKSA